MSMRRDPFFGMPARLVTISIDLPDQMDLAETLKAIKDRVVDYRQKGMQAEAQMLIALATHVEYSRRALDMAFVTPPRLCVTPAPVTYPNASTEPVESIRSLECDTIHHGLARDRFQALWNEIERLRAENARLGAATVVGSK